MYFTSLTRVHRWCDRRGITTRSTQCLITSRFTLSGATSRRVAARVRPFGDGSNRHTRTFESESPTRGIAGSFPRASTCSPFKPRKSSPRCASTHALAPVRFGASHRGARATRASHDAATIIGDSVSGRSRTIETDAAGRARERRVVRRSGANKYLAMRSRGERTRRLTRDALAIAG